MTTTRDYLDEIEAQLAARTPEVASGSGRRAGPIQTLRHRRELLALIPALAAAAAIVVVVLASLSGPLASHRQHAQPASGHRPSSLARHRHAVHRSHPKANPTAPPASRSSAPAGPVPSGFSPVSFTALSELQWWLLGSAPCSSPPCTSIVRTDDGGRSFVGLPAPRTDGVSQLRFADRSDGFAYGPELWTTHDAGAHWHQVGLVGQVVDLEAGGGYVYAIYRLHDGHGLLMRSPAGSDHWVTLYGAGDAYGGLWVYGSDVLLESSTSRAQELMISHDGGATFSAHPVPPSVACRFEEQPGVIWAPCATGMMSGVWRSTDGGVHFNGVGGDATREIGPAEPNSAVFAAASATTAVYGFQDLFRTVDGGARWSAVATPRGATWSYLGFTDATHGAGIARLGSASRLYYTTDAGASYHMVPIH